MGNWKSTEKSVIKRKVTLAIIGLDNAGKTLLSKGLKGENPSDTTPTIGFSSISFVFEGNDIVLYDLGGGKNIREIWKKYFYEVYGIIFVIDASDPKRLKESHDEIIKLLSNKFVKGKPLLVLANKQDIVGAMDEKDICENLCLEDLVTKHQTPCKVESCSALLRQGNNKLDDSIKIGFSWLMKVINLKWEELSTRVKNDIKLNEDNDKKEKKERNDRVKLSRELREEEESKLSSRRKITSRRSDDDENDYKTNMKFKSELNPWRPLDQHIKKVETKPLSSKAPVQNGRSVGEDKFNSSYTSAKLLPEVKTSLSSSRLGRLMLSDDDDDTDANRDDKKKSMTTASNSALYNSSSYKPNGILTSATPRKSATFEDLPNSKASNNKVVKKARFNQVESDDDVSENDSDHLTRSNRNSTRDSKQDSHRDSKYDSHRDHKKDLRSDSKYDSQHDSKYDSHRSSKQDSHRDSKYDSHRDSKQDSHRDLKYDSHRDKPVNGKPTTTKHSLLQLEDSDSEEEEKPVSRFDQSDDDDDSFKYKADYRKTIQYSR